MTTSAAVEAPTVPRYVRIAEWIWLIGMAVSVLGAVYSVTQVPAAPMIFVLVITLIQAAVAIPAALALPRGKRWARMTLMVLAVLSIGSLYSAMRMQAWPSLVFNLVLGCTIGLFQDATVRAFFGLHREPWLRRRMRGAQD